MGNRYVPKQEIMRRYPDDVDQHFHAQQGAENGTLLQVDPAGQPLLRVIERGRLVAQGRPVPAITRGTVLVANEDFTGDFFGKAVVLLVDHGENGSTGVILNKNLSEAERVHQIIDAHRRVEHASEELREAHEKLEEEQGKVAASKDKALQEGTEIALRGRAMVELLATPGVELRMGGPVGLEDFPFSQQLLILHPFKKVKSEFVLKGEGTPEDPDLYLSRPALLRWEDIAQIVVRTREHHTRWGFKAGQRIIVFLGMSGWGPHQLAGELRGGLYGKAAWAWSAAARPRDVFRLPGLLPRNARVPLLARGGPFWRLFWESPTLQRMEADGS
eukprot:NODE_1527_length_1119_cov_303.856203.p1 GENE.NODE_1527_length_1119_cov_303.856203~~NODE_1527_length_1119_cov_303.856203.p1  ORF type:complete len:331 (-),score=110.57 NODE_1527_length_1119_cov_303.856203:96-1088(-)